VHASPRSDPPKLDGAHLLALLDDLDAALRELAAPFERDDARWAHAATGRWSAGQHVEHVGHVLAIGATALEAAADQLLRGDLGKRPWRDPIQALFVRTVTRKFPSGARSPRAAVPQAAPERARTFALLAQGALRHRSLGERLAVDQRERLWIWNPYAPALRWHYTFAEEVRVQTTHARHHARKAIEAPAGESTEGGSR
jgi:hypothetical protein